MGMLVSEIAAMSTLHPEANPSLKGDKIYNDKKFMNKQIYRLLGNAPTLAASCYRHRLGRPVNTMSKARKNNLAVFNIFNVFRDIFFFANYF